MKQRKVEHKANHGHQQQDDLFLLLHDNCWIPEDTLFPNDGVSTSSERWIPPSICDGSLQHGYFNSIDSATQHPDEPLASGNEEIMLFNDINIFSSGVNYEGFIAEIVSSDKVDQQMLPSANSYYSATSKEERSPNEYIWKGVETEIPSAKDGLLPVDDQGHRKLVFCNFQEGVHKHKMQLIAPVTVSTDIKTFSCDACNKSFKLKSKLKAHKVTHSDSKPFSCEICDKPFKRKGELKSHMVVHSDAEPFICRICGLGFKRKTNLRSHMVNHSNIKPFSCEVCDMRFKFKWELKNHMVVHSDAKPFTCNVCKKKFKRKGDAKQHMFVHFRT